MITINKAKAHREELIQYLTHNDPSNSYCNSLVNDCKDVTRGLLEIIASLKEQIISLEKGNQETALQALSDNGQLMEIIENITKERDIARSDEIDMSLELDAAKHALQKIARRLSAGDLDEWSIGALKEIAEKAINGEQDG